MNPRAAALPVFAAGLVLAVLGVQVAHGGGDFVPNEGADPCAGRTVESAADGLDALAEQLVLLGLDAAACRLEVSREALVLRLAAPGRRPDAEVEAMRSGLHDAVDRLDRAGRLPTASELAEQVPAQTDLPELVTTAMRAVPDRFLDERLPTADVLRRTVDEVDIGALLAGVENPAEVQDIVRDTVVRAAIAEFVEGLPDLFG